VEQLDPSKSFIPNDVCLDHGNHQLLLISGPNMAGKSVLMRQVALITLLAHIGSYVPAQSATISITDQIFVRSGAADMITAGLSTFMVEMVETAYILHHATDKSLVIMDEIGRGTSTYDGISIAWAVAEALIGARAGKVVAATGPKTLFATHYYELQALAIQFSQKIQNYHMAITEHHGKPVFLYQFTPGPASHSYGVAVAELAGVPSEVIERAEAMLSELENEKVQPAPQKKSRPTQPPLPFDHPLIEELKKISVENLTPLEALNMLAQWKQKISG
jgi:DNA mismatch repair protein MutS